MFNRIMLAVLPMLACAGGVMIWCSLDVPIQKFVVRGASSAALSTREQASVRQLLAEHQFAGILSTGLGDVRAALEQLPWTRGVAVRRQWPDAMVITLQRAQPIARWGTDRYLSAAGELMSLPDEYLGLPSFDVAVATPAQTLGVYRLLDQVLWRANLNISRLQQNRQGEWSVAVKAPGVAQAGLTLLLGAEQLNERAHRYLLLHRQVLANGGQQVAYVDARYASGLAVRYQPEATGQTLLSKTEPTPEQITGPKAEPMTVATTAATTAAKGMAKKASERAPIKVPERALPVSPAESQVPGALTVLSAVLSPQLSGESN